MVTLKGSSLVESLVALSIVSISFIIGMMVVGTLLASHDSALQLRAEMALKTIANNTVTNKLFIDELIDSTDFYVKREIVPYEGFEKIYTLTLTATDSKDKLLDTYKELIYIP